MSSSNSLPPSIVTSANNSPVIDSASVNSHNSNTSNSDPVSGTVATNEPGEDSLDDASNLSSSRLNHDEDTTSNCEDTYSTGSKTDLTVGSTRSNGDFVESSPRSNRTSIREVDRTPSNVATCCKYLCNSVQSNVLKAHLKAAYSAFSFFQHSFGFALQHLGLVRFRGLLQAFYDDVSVKNIFFFTYVG